MPFFAEAICSLAEAKCSKKFRIITISVQLTLKPGLSLAKRKRRGIRRRIRRKKRRSTHGFLTTFTRSFL